MDYDLVVRFCEEVSPAVQAKYRFLGRRWWMIRDGHWTQDSAREHLMHELLLLSKQTSIPGLSGQQVRENVQKTHIMNQVVARLGGLMYNYRGLPAPGPCCRAQS